MRKHLEAYQANPSLKNAQAVRAYGRKHPFSACLLGVLEMDAMADAIHHANKGSK